VKNVSALLAEAYIEAGMEPMDAARQARAAVEVLAAAEALPPDRLEAWERDAAAYGLKGAGVPMDVIRGRLGLGRSAAYKAIERHLRRRRAALKKGRGD
jgi:hypothetical protein